LPQQQFRQTDRQTDRQLLSLELWQASKIKDMDKGARPQSAQISVNFGNGLDKNDPALSQNTANQNRGSRRL